MDTLANEALGFSTQAILLVILYLVYTLFSLLAVNRYFGKIYVIFSPI